MTIPDKPLEVTIDLKDLTLKEMKLFSAEGFDFYRFTEFLAKHTNWSGDEIDAVTVGELEEVAKQLGAAIQARAVPLAT